MALSKNDIERFRQRVQPSWTIMTTGRRVGTVSARDGDKLLVVWEGIFNRRNS